jgi:hypothetical protein
MTAEQLIRLARGILAMPQRVSPRISCTLVLLLSMACQGATTPLEGTGSVEVTGRVAPPAPEPANTATIDEPGDPIDQQPAPAPEIWRLTSLVTGGAEGFEKLLGANGFYELEIVGDTATLRKVGQKGTPRFPDAEILTGSATLAIASNTEWPAATRHTLEVDLSDLSGKGKTRRIALDLWFLGDEVHGTFAVPNDGHEGKVGDSWGLVQGRRGAGEPLVIENGANTPCMVCVRAFFNCDSGFFDEVACNSADSSRYECEQKLARARAAAAEIPRGCGDYFL